ncbi:winged helix-turn-helix domain-containing protein [Rheinheimera muenzenbergensis]|uniref:Winged helix-turn-helix domain-containing protein n=2 Tax=Rheinheimera muenzenbergensis TaxID=1193628 RepID=A0ABU8C919_9GAMM|nr:winged helix-turn-helix domain-containing protein [Gammaproteobacteria bacterium]MBU1557103.1 winged helix-turn-helix domain-containing protein [Gammaproteobacteria bacterium]MBU2069932.1 winged helix-turn-helix domain-containing protein [Gammaproteobacteria bacterium]MBU2185077.1 winged helix-turn-helix domain-containing protein [Gammaproteobacteria bacterium]MBU2206945.1 winged helix-turn-helix domain-containing protein [Gammaproteobacteria bacterium]
MEYFLMAKILLVEDDTRLASLVQSFLTQHGFSVQLQTQGDAVAEHCRQFQPDLVVLDLMLPGLDGFGVCRQLRPWYKGPILILTAKQSDIDQVLGLELGADDYVIKPVEPRVLVARINALLRRTQTPARAEQQELQFGALTLKQRAREAWYNQQRVELTSYEFDLLWMLARHAGQTVKREAIHQQIIGREYDGLDRTVDVRISHLRRKLGDNAETPFRIKTVWGKGYLFVADAW